MNADSDRADRAEAALREIEAFLVAYNVALVGKSSVESIVVAAGALGGVSGIIRTYREGKKGD